MEFADLGVEFAVWAEFDVAAVVIEGVGCGAGDVEDVLGIVSRVSGCGVPAYVASGVRVGVPVGVVDVDVAVCGEGRVQGQA